jgi:hypothetical protein
MRASTALTPRSDEVVPLFWIIQVCAEAAMQHTNSSFIGRLP